MRSAPGAHLRKTLSHSEVGKVVLNHSIETKGTGMPVFAPHSKCWGLRNIRVNKLHGGLAHPSATLLKLDATDVSCSLPESVNNLCIDGIRIPEEPVPLSAEQGRQLMPLHRWFITDTLLIEMHVIIHMHLMLATGHFLDAHAKRVKDLLVALWVAEKRVSHAWAYRKVILLTEARNSVAHCRGQFRLPNQRLVDSG